MKTLDAENGRLATLRARSVTVNNELARFREEAVRCLREIGEARVAGTLDPDANPPREVDSRCKKLESQRIAAQGELDKLAAEVAPLASAIQSLESDLAVLGQNKALDRQAAVREEYQAVARKILVAANLLSELSLEAKRIFDGAESEFPIKEELAADGRLILPKAGLSQVWDHEFIYRHGNPTRRDMIVGSVFDFDRSLVDEADPVAKLKRHWEDQQQKRYAEIERARQIRNAPTAADLEAARAAASARGETITAIVNWPPPMPALSGSMGNAGRVAAQ
jgi:hypothetical protein